MPDMKGPRRTTQCPTADCQRDKPNVFMVAPNAAHDNKLQCNSSSLEMHSPLGSHSDVVSLEQPRVATSPGAGLQQWPAQLTWQSRQFCCSGPSSTLPAASGEAGPTHLAVTAFLSFWASALCRVICCFSSRVVFCWRVRSKGMSSLDCTVTEWSGCCATASPKRFHSRRSCTDCRKAVSPCAPTGGQARTWHGYHSIALVLPPLLR